MTKRRDNAPFVKIVFGGIIDIIMEKCKLLPAIHYLQKCMQQLTNHKFGLEKLTIRVDDMMNNKVNIDRLQQDVERLRIDTEKLKDSVRANIGKLNGDH